MKKNEEFSWDKVPLSALECKILLLLIKEDRLMDQKEMEKRTKSTRGGISKAINKLRNKGLIYPLKNPILFYGLNPYRKQEIKRFFIGYDLGKNKPVVLSGHAFVYDAEINDLPDKLAKKLEKDPAFLGYYPKGWKYAFRAYLPDGSFKLYKSKKECKLIAYFRTFGFDPHIIEQINNEKFFRLKSELENIYLGLKIGTPRKIAKCPWQEYSIQKDHIAIKGIGLGIRHVSIEQSYGYPEWEEKGHNAREKIAKIIEMREKELEEIAPLNKKDKDLQEEEIDKNKEGDLP